MYDLFYTWLLPVTLAGTLAALLSLALGPVLQKMPWRSQKLALGLTFVFFLAPVGPLLALAASGLPSQAQPLEQVGTALETAAQTAADTVQLRQAPAVTAPLAHPAAAQPDLAGQILALLPWIWAAGAVLCAAWQLGRYARFRRGMRRCSTPAAERDQTRLRLLCVKYGWMAPLPVFWAEGIASPLLVGILRPALYLPRQMDGPELELALRHELAHLNGADLWLKALSQLACWLHWFDPVCRWQAARLERVCEFACDEAAVGGLDTEQRKAYGRVLLQAASASLPAGVSGLSSSGRGLKKRLEALFCEKKASRGQRAAAAGCMAAALLFTACASAGMSASAPVPSGSGQGVLLPENGSLLQTMRLQQESETVQAKTAPEPMPEPEEKPALREGQARVEWVRQNQTVLSGYDYVLDESLAEGEYVIDREAVPGTDEVSGWSFYDASGLLVDRQQVSRVSLQAPVQGVVRYNGERAAIEGKVTAHGIERGLLPGIEDVGTLIWPVPDYTYVSRWMSEYHKGSDLIAPKGAPVYAMADGTVTEAQYHYSHGNCVVIQHGGGVSTLYSHLSEISVAAGDTVTQGELIGSVGSTGNSTGNHCHVEIRVDGQLQSLKDYFPDK